VDWSSLLNSIDPATGEVIGTYADGSADEAIAPSLSHARRSSKRRGAGTGAYARAINEMADRFEARTGKLIDVLALAAALTLAEPGRAIDVEPGRFSMVLKEPMGVAGTVAPWNSPVVLFMRSLGPALAAGCTVVGKLPGWTAQTNAEASIVFDSRQARRRRANQSITAAR
jgi:betaine-aldehyde dehydrogenase